MMPGMAHCRRGPGGDSVDWITVLENWVEKGEAPGKVIV
ncbi:MAG: tannase/feruloyl esterase family alpha/beta hydrolase, partial [Alphaproteobacteria bacterium]|nr:tannase/feruloyl esterase family alpha/beta hydrolase [Alphaproteobacteria bacterium]